MVATTVSREINLDLRPGRDGGANEVGGFIQQGAEQRLLKLLTENEVPSTAVDAGSRAGASNIMADRRHDAIFVNARRGAGKTTFLLNVLRRLDSEEVPARNGKPLRSLGIIDPTLIETKQHIVVVVIDRIRAEVDAAKRSRARSTPDSYAGFQQSLGKLARGLGMLDGIGKEAFYGREWGDPEFVLDQGLEDARAAVDFEREFHGFIERACEFLGIHSFVLAIDDIDTWFERGWPVLEAVRKYLTSPRLQIVLSGDLELYSLLVRASQWKQMGRDFLAAEQWQEQGGGAHGRMGSITRKVDELQDQYLIKVLKPERRIDLQPLLDFKDELRLRLPGPEAAPVDAQIFGDRFCAEALALHAPPERRDVLNLLLRLPTRSALQIMLAAADMISAADDQSRDKALDGLRYVAWTDLLNLQLSPGETQALAPRMLPTLLGRWFTEAGLWRSMPRLHPETVDVGHGLPAIFGAALAVESFRKDPSQMVAYWLKISTVREMLDSNQVSETDELAAEGRTLPRLIAHLNLTALESGLQTVSRLAAWELVLKRQVKPGVYFSVVSVPLERVRERGAASWDLYGEIYKQGRDAPGTRLVALVRNPPGENRSQTPAPLREFHQKLAAANWQFPQRDFGFEGSFANSIGGLIGKTSGAAKLVAALPVLEIVSGQQKGQGGYSFLRLVATVGELLEVAAEIGDDHEALAARVRGVLSAAALHRSYPTPGTDFDEDADARSSRSRTTVEVLEADDADDESDSDEGAADGANDAQGQALLVEELVKWLEVWQGRVQPVAPLVLSRIWARFNYAHRSIRQRLKHLESRYLGTFVFRSLVAFLHAVLIESVRGAGGVASSNSNNNPITAPEPFVSLLHDIDNAVPGGDLPGWGSAHLSLFEALFTCPLWAFFLPRKPDIPWRREPRANTMIFDAYEACRGANGLEGVDILSSVSYRPDGGEFSIEFAGLYDLLNTVHMQGNPKKPPPRPGGRRGREQEDEAVTQA